MFLTALVFVTLVVAGLQFLFWITGQTTSTHFLEVVANFLQWVTVPGVGFALIFRLLFPRDDITGIRPEDDQPLYSSNPWADNIPDATITPLQGNAVRMDARGRAFIIAVNRRGVKAAREIDPQSGEYLTASYVTGSDRDPKGRDHSLATHLKYKINTGT